MDENEIRMRHSTFDPDNVHSYLQISLRNCSNYPVCACAAQGKSDWFVYLSVCVSVDIPREGQRSWYHVIRELAKT